MLGPESTAGSLSGSAGGLSCDLEGTPLVLWSSVSAVQ